MWRQKHISGDNGMWCSPQQIQQEMADVQLGCEPEDASLCDGAARLKRKNGLGRNDEPGAFRACELWNKEGTCVAPVVYRDVQSRTRPQNLCPVKGVRGVPGSSFEWGGPRSWKGTIFICGTLATSWLETEQHLSTVPSRASPSRPSALYQTQ